MTPIRSSRLTPVCLRLALDLLRRDFQKYAPITVAMFAGRWGLERWRVRLIRASYFYFRYLDDVADGDRACADGPGLFLDRQSSQWRVGFHAGDGRNEAEILFSFIGTEFVHRNFPWHRVRVLALDIIKGLRFDLERRLQRQVVSQATLDRYYDQVVLAPANLAHLILGARAAPEALQEISGVIGRLQSLRDLRADWVAGLINIPMEDLDRPPSFRSIASWRDREIECCGARLRVIWKRWHSHADERSCALMRPAVQTLLRWVATSDPGRRALFIGQTILARC